MAKLVINIPDNLLERLETAVTETFKPPADAAPVAPRVLVRRAARLYLMDVLAGYEIKTAQESAGNAKRAQIRAELGPDDQDEEEVPDGEGRAGRRASQP